ncbi:MAG: CPBP family intramembrane metalloprotease, partial [Mycolicibacterium sp.]|nr:CPBP family intramembrane metalloprotease [Mycolicibacterium sp.]
MNLFSEFGDIVGSRAAPYQETDKLVRRRRIIVGVVLVIGAVLLGFSLTR